MNHEGNTTYSTWPAWTLWMLNKQLPVEILVAFGLWFVGGGLFLSGISSAENTNSLTTFLGAGMVMGIGGAIAYAFCAAVRAALNRSGCIVGCAYWPVLLFVALVYLPPRALSSLIVLPLLRALAGRASAAKPLLKPK